MRKKRNFSEFLPNKFILYFVVIPIFLFIIFFLTKDLFGISFFQNENKEINNNLSKKTQESIKDFRLDTDGDGLFDWEERLYRSDIKKKDTDGDGIIDGMEVARGTDPIDPFNKISIINKEILKNEDQIISYRDDDNLTKTDVVARDFFIKLMELKKTNLTKNQDAREQAIHELIRQNRIILSDKYTLDDLNISETLSIKDFKKNLENLLNKHHIEMFKDEVFLLASFLKTDNKLYLSKIEQQVKSYKEIENELLVMEIPKRISPLFLEYLNSFNLFIEITDFFSKAKNDSVFVASIILLYNRVEDRMKRSSSSINYFFQFNI